MTTIMRDHGGMSEALIAAVDELTGGSVDALTLIAKYSPDAADVHINQPLDAETRRRQKRQAQVGLASNVVGIAAGTAALGQAGARAAEVRAAQKAGRKAEPGQFIRSARWARDNIPGAAKVAGNAKVRRVARAATSPRAIAIGAGGALALQAANTGGDLVANRVLAREANKKHPVSKLSIPGGVKAATGKIKDGVRQQKGLGPKVRRVVDPRARARAKADRTTLADNAPGIAAAGRKKVRRLGMAGIAAVSGGAGYAYGSAPPGQIVPTGDQLLRRRGQPAGTQQQLPLMKRSAKKQAFGWISVTNHPTEGVGPDKVVLDRQGDIIHIDDLEEAAYRYVRESRVAGEMHMRDADDKPTPAGDLIESFVVTPEKLTAMGVPEDVAKQVPVGWWGGYQVTSDDTWDKIESKKLTGFSIHGSGVRTPVEKLEDIIGKKLTPLTPADESRKIKRLKQTQAGLSLTGSMLGLSALGLKGAAGAQARKAVKGYGATRSAAIGRSARLDRASNQALTVGAGVGGAGGINFAALQRREARRENG